MKRERGEGGNTVRARVARVGCESKTKQDASANAAQEAARPKEPTAARTMDPNIRNASIRTGAVGDDRGTQQRRGEGRAAGRRRGAGGAVAVNLQIHRNGSTGQNHVTMLQTSEHKAGRLRQHGHQPRTSRLQAASDSITAQNQTTLQIANSCVRTGQTAVQAPVVRPVVAP